MDEKEKIILPDDFNLKECSYLMINPLTALCFLEIAKVSFIYKQIHKSNSIIHTAGASSVGRMITRLLKKNQIELINTVRK